MIKNNETFIESHKSRTEKNVINFDKFSIKNLSFSYSNSKKKIFDKVNLEIKANDKVGIRGKTGVGKTTFLNIVTGLIKCDEGEVLINNKDINLIKFDWQKIIGYVPQQVSIIDESILFNITLESDEKKIDFKKLDDVLQTVDLYNHIYSLPKNVHEVVGERRGEKLSGGQSQRLGIARALYKDPKVLILDEATNSLDENTENLILEKLFKKISNKTILTISHTNNSLKYCNKVIELKDGFIKEIN